jgi:predicted transglutaminase-like cysteine proteinase
MGGKFGQMVALAAALLLAACQSPQLAVSALPNNPLASGGRSAVAQNADPSTPMPAGANADAPSGYLAFCARQPAECADPADAPDIVPFSAGMWATLQEINTAYNAAIRPEEDSIHYGRVDYWTIPTDGYGDCEDYALAKRKALIAAHLSPRALRIAVARSRQGEPHAVLTVATDRGDYVLDNLTDAILPWRDTNLAWIARQTPGRTQWALLDASAPSNLAVASTGALRPTHQLPGRLPRAAPKRKVRVAVGPQSPDR